MTPVLQWIKSHVLIVICSAIIIGAPVAAYIVSGGMNASLRDELQSSASSLRKLDGLRSTNVSLEVPGGKSVSMSAVANPKLIEAYEKAVKSISGASETVHTAGLRKNRRSAGRMRSADDLVDAGFPVPKSKKAYEELPFEFHTALVAAYAKLFDRVGAGMPPSIQEVGEQLSRNQMYFVSNKARKDSVSELDDREVDTMRSELSDARLNFYRSWVSGESGRPIVRFYADESALRIPPEPTTLVPLATLFDWQWKFWITEDILLGLASANGDQSVITGPVKRVLSLSIEDLGVDVAESGRSGSSAGRSGGMAGGTVAGRNNAGRGRGASAGRGAPSGAAVPAHPGKAQVDPSREARIDHGVSITGRQTNDVYDVRRVTCSLVVSTTGITDMVDALSRQNFMTVLDLRIRPVNVFEAATEGFIYGIEPVSKVDLVIETIWMREWTADLMPPDLRDALGIRSTPNAG